MKGIYWLLVTGLLMAEVAAASDVGRFRGAAATNSILTARLLKSAEIDVLAHYLGGNPGQGDGLISLLGAFDPSGLDSHLRNADPNAANLVLWHLVFDGLSRDIAGLCEAAPDVMKEYAGETLKAAVLPLCAWPAPSARTEASLLNLWLTIQGFDAPYDEFTAWRDFLLSDAYAQAPASKAVFAAVFSAFFNPYFLLQE